MIIELLQGELEITDNPGLMATDPRFDEVATLIQDGNYLQATRLSEILLADGIYDIRIICYFLYGYWLEQNLLSLNDVLMSLNHLISANWSAIGPLVKREKNVQTSLSWLFRQVLKTLQYEEKKRTVLWQKWLDSVKTADIENLLAEGEIFCVSLEQQLESQAKPLLEMWVKIEHWLRTLQQLLHATPQLNVEQPENTPVNETKISLPSPEQPFKVEQTSLESSYHMQVLLKKLAAFDHLLQEQKLPKAALLAEDIRQTLANFDPLVYFPKTFEGFVRLQAIHFEELSSYAEQRDTPQWEAMQDWLKIDLESFVNN